MQIGDHDFKVLASLTSLELLWFVFGAGAETKLVSISRSLLGALCVVAAAGSVPQYSMMALVTERIESWIL